MDEPDDWHDWPDPAREQWLTMQLTRAELFAAVAEEIGTEWDDQRQNDPRFRKHEVARLYLILSRIPTPYRIDR